jgi:beta-phosphoglucomutase family hydrolase
VNISTALKFVQEDTSMTPKSAAVTPDRFDAVLFDLDGVITDTAKLHAACWKRAFDSFLKKRAARTDEPFHPFDLHNDYEEYVDGKPRYDGVRSFLDSRGIELPYGDPDDSADKETVCGLGNLKDELFGKDLKSEGVEVFQGTITWIRHLRKLGIKTAVVSSSRHCRAVLEAVGVKDLFDAEVDGNVIEDLDLKGKPAPDTYLKAAEMLGVEPRRAVVVEDALSGVKAGRIGAFELVIGVDRLGDADALRENGADLVVTDLSDLLP